jgi:hypothetical protein
MRAILAALQSPAYWRHGFSWTRTGQALLSSFGAMWLGAEIVSFFSEAGGIWLRRQWIAFLVVGLFFALWLNRPRVRFACRLAGRDVVVEIRVGDMFAMPGALAIGSNTSFDTDVTNGLIAETSVQGQFTKKYYNAVSHLDGDLAAALTGIAPAYTSTTKKGKASVYPIGTTVHVVAQQRRAYFVAIATMNDHGVASGTFDDLKTSLPMLWDYVATKGGGIEPLVVPVLGSGFSRLPQPREEIVRAIVQSFIAACSSARPTEKLTVVIPFKDFHEHQVDFVELERYVQHVCQYTEYRSSGAVGTGTALSLPSQRQPTRDGPTQPPQAQRLPASDVVSRGGSQSPALSVRAVAGTASVGGRVLQSADVVVENSGGSCTLVAYARLANAISGLGPSTTRWEYDPRSVKGGYGQSIYSVATLEPPDTDTRRVVKVRGEAMAMRERYEGDDRLWFDVEWEFYVDDAAHLAKVLTCTSRISLNEQRDGFLVEVVDTVALASAKA